MEFSKSNTPFDSRAIHYPSDINTNNYTKWLDTIVKTTLYGSEFPIPLLPPDSKHNYYRFMDGTKVSHFIVNSLGTGNTVPAPNIPKIVYPKVDNQNKQFGNISTRYRERVNAGPNFFNLR